MGIAMTETKSPPHWRHFLALEEDLASTVRYIEFAEANFKTYSVEFTSLLLSACSEVDVVCKLLCKNLDKKSKASNIGHYASKLGSAYPSLGNFEVEIPRFGLKFQPWKNWAGKSRKSPLWWGAHNKVKHNRDDHFGEANLSNVLNALAGLYVATLHLYKSMAESAELGPTPLLFRPGGDYFSGVTHMDTEVLINYSFGS